MAIINSGHRCRKSLHFSFRYILPQEVCVTCLWHYDSHDWSWRGFMFGGCCCQHKWPFTGRGQLATLCELLMTINWLSRWCSHSSGHIVELGMSLFGLSGTCDSNRSGPQLCPYIFPSFPSVSLYLSCSSRWAYRHTENMWLRYLSM